MSTTDADDDSTVHFELEVRSDRTILTVEGQRDATVIVRSESGERIYLPPEGFDDEPRTTAYSTTPYSTSTDSETESVTTPYSTSTDATAAADEEEAYGRTRTPAGVRIVHPEPVTDVRFVR